MSIRTLIHICYCGSSLTCFQLLNQRQNKYTSVKHDTTLCLWAKRPIKLNMVLIKSYLLLGWRLLPCHYIQLMNCAIVIITWDLSFPQVLNFRKAIYQTFFYFRQYISIPLHLYFILNITPSFVDLSMGKDLFEGHHQKEDIFFLFLWMSAY